MEAFDEDRFEKEVLVPACTDPMGIDIVADGRVLWIERGGNLSHGERQPEKCPTCGGRKFFAADIEQPFVESGAG